MRTAFVKPESMFAIVLCSAVGLFASGCDLCGGLPFLCPAPEGGTGVPGLNTASEIVNNPQVADVIRRLEQALGFSVNLSMDDAVDPPNIEGQYRISGTQLVPGRGTLGSGTFRWSNQTPDNHISTDYRQFASQGEQAAVSVVGEIIRGEGRLFTVYSILDAVQGACRVRAVFIMGGVKRESGDVIGTYCGAILSSNCDSIDTSGLYEFERQ